MKRTVLLVAIVGASFAANASDEAGPALRRIKLPPPGDGAIELPAPPTWRVEATRPLAFVPPTIEFSPPEGKAFSVLITVLQNLNNDPTFNDPKTISEMVAKMRDEAVKFATTRHISILGVKGDQLSGNYYTATDRKPKPDEWRYITQGSASLQDLLLTFTIFSNDPEQPEAASTLAMLQKARRVVQ